MAAAKRKKRMPER